MIVKVISILAIVFVGVYLISRAIGESNDDALVNGGAAAWGCGSILFQILIVAGIIFFIAWLFA